MLINGTTLNKILKSKGYNIKKIETLIDTWVKDNVCRVI